MRARSIPLGGDQFTAAGPGDWLGVSGGIWSSRECGLRCSESADRRIELIAKDGFNLNTQNGNLLACCQPDYFPVESKIGMHEDVAKGRDLSPRYSRMARTQLSGNPCSSLTDGGQFLKDGTTDQFGVTRGGFVKSG